MNSSLLGDAFAHHLWATERLMDECASLTAEQLAAPAPGTYGSIIDTLRHLVSSDAWYLSFFSDEVARVDEKAETSLEDLRSAFSTNGPLWLQLLAESPDPDSDIVEIDDGWELHSPTSLRLAQVIHHGTDHRSQVCTALTSLGMPPPEIDVWAYARATGREQGVELPDAPPPSDP